jgi:hypothetical protein
MSLLQALLSPQVNLVVRGTSRQTIVSGDLAQLQSA